MRRKGMGTAFFIILLAILLFTTVPTFQQLIRSDQSKYLDEKFYITETSCDTHISSANPTTAYGTADILEVRSNSSTGEEAVIWLKFNLYDPLNPNHLSVGDEITWASVSVRGEVKMNGTAGLILGAYSCNHSSWSENDLTWNSAPWANVTETALDLASTHYGYGYVMGYELNSTVYFFTVTTAAKQAHELGQELTIVLKTEGDGVQFFWSREDPNFWSSDYKPTLEVQYQPSDDDTEPSLDTSQEYSSGMIIEDGLWYTWVNVSSVQLIYITAIYPLYDLYFPSFHILGQHYHAEDGTELFIGHMLLLYEIFDDNNHNGLLDADFNTGNYETSYYLDLNISDVFAPQSVQKTLIDGSPHYLWSLRYENVWGFLKFPEGPQPMIGDTAGLIWLEYLETKYDYFLQGNATYLKTSLSLGPITQIESFIEPFTLTNLGVTALYSTILLASSETTRVLIESSEYDSHLTNPTLLMSNATIAGPTMGYYSLRFEENYTLYATPPQSYPAPSSACPSSSVNPLVHGIQYQEPFNAFRDFLTAFLPRISNLSMPNNYNFEDTDLLYRVNYPQWDGYAINHDPLYIAYLSDAPRVTHPTPYNLPWPLLMLTVAFFGVIILSLAIYDLRRIRAIKTQIEHEE